MEPRLRYFYIWAVKFKDFSSCLVLFSSFLAVLWVELSIIRGLQWHSTRFMFSSRIPKTACCVNKEYYLITIHSSSLIGLPGTQALIHYFHLQLLIWFENIWELQTQNSDKVYVAGFSKKKREVDGGYIISCTTLSSLVLMENFCCRYVLIIRNWILDLQFTCVVIGRIFQTLSSDSSVLTLPVPAALGLLTGL